LPLSAGLNLTSGFASNIVYFKFSNLTGVFNANGSITFNPSGGIALYAEDDADFNPLTGNVKTLATFNLINPSAGSNVDFFGGANPTGTINVTLVETSGISGLYTDSSNATLPLNITLHLGNVNALVDPNASESRVFWRNWLQRHHRRSDLYVGDVMRRMRANTISHRMSPSRPLCFAWHRTQGWAGTRRRRSRA
jgi:hypothetical protein